MWALGVLLYQALASMNHPCGQKTQWQLINAIQSDQPLNFPNPISPYIKEIIVTLLEKNPENRPDARELL